MPASLRTQGFSRLVACMAVIAAFWLAAAPVRAQLASVSLLSFNDTNGAIPVAPLVQGSDGNFYGTTAEGGTNESGTVFKLTPPGTPANQWALITLHQFATKNSSGDNADGANPLAALVPGSDGNFYGTTEYGGSSGDGTVFKVTPAGVFTTLVTFTGTNGADPYAALVLGSDGNFYGTTASGGASGDGTVFKVTPVGSLITLYSFSALNGNSENSDGASPEAAVIQGSDGNFYGTTIYGGTSDAGTVFKITPTGTLTTLATFNRANGQFPISSLVLGGDGNFYGTTEYGGASSDGTVFQVTPMGTLTTLVTFNGTNGAYPLGGLVLSSDNNFYGTTAYGGTSSDGTVFKVTPPIVPATQWVLTTLHSYTGGNDGDYPEAALVQGSDGNFYGTSVGNDGKVFGLFGPPTTFAASETTNQNTPLGFTVAFDDPSVKGITNVAFPTLPAHGTVTAGAITETGGPGTVVLTYTPAAGYTGADNFTYTVTDGYVGISSPQTVSMTVVGSASNAPTITSFSRASGAVGTNVIITGTNFTGAQSVTFNGTAALFTVNSAAQITTIVPSGATTGVIDVQTPSGLAVSTTDFTVLPLPIASLTLGTQTATQATFSATATSTDGTPLAYVWSASPATASGFTGVASGHAASGMPFTNTLKAGAAGTYMVTMTVTDTRGFTATAVQTVTFSQALTTVTVTPATASVPPGGMQAFTATAADQFGAVFTPVSLIWSVSGGGAIDQSGDFTAGITPGIFTVTANATGSGVTQTGTAAVTVNPPFTPAAITLGSASVYGSQTTILTVTLAAPAPTGGLVVTLSSNNTAAASLPATVTVAAGQTVSPPVTVTTSPVQFAASVMLTASAAGGAASATLVVNPPAIQSMTISPSQISGGGSATLTVTLNLPAPVNPTAFGVIVSLASNNAAATVPSYLDIRQGATSATTTIQTTVVSATQTATITGTAPGTSGSATLTIAVPPPTATLTLGTQTSTQATLSATATSGDGTPLHYSWALYPNATPGFTGPTSGAAASGTPFSNTLSVSAAGSYSAIVSVTDAYGQSSTANQLVTFSQIPTAVTVSPATIKLLEHGAQTFAATVKDQFGNALIPASLTWGVSGGTIDQSGDLTAGATPGTFTITASATSNGVTQTGTATVTVLAPPTVTIMPGTQTATQVSLSATAASGDGTALTYAWSVTPSATPGFVGALTGSVASGTPFTNTLNVTAAMTYTVTVTVTDAYGQTATATQVVTFSQVPTAVTVSPAPASVPENGTQAFTATVTDQFGAVISAPSVSWSVSGGGTINASTGAFTAGTIPGTFTVTARASGAGASIAGTAMATVFSTALTVTSFTPTSGPVGAVVTIIGTNLGGVTAVRFHNSSATVFSANAAGTQLTVIVPKGAATGTITITTPGGSVKTATNFTVTTVAAPTITSFSPTSGPAGTSVVITGTNMTGAASVSFHGTAATFTINSATQITATVPSGATTGAISVTTAGGTATSTGSFTVTYPAPTITSFTPASGPVGTVVTLTGTNLGGTSAVRFHNANAKTFTVNGAGTQITITVPNGAGTGTITVTTPGGSVKSAKSFTVTSS